MKTTKDKLEHQLSILGYLITKLDVLYFNGEITHSFKKRWHGRIHIYMVNCAESYAKEHAIEFAKSIASDIYAAGANQEPYTDVLICTRPRCRGVEDRSNEIDFDDEYLKQQ